MGELVTVILQVAGVVLLVVLVAGFFLWRQMTKIFVPPQTITLKPTPIAPWKDKDGAEQIRNKILGFGFSEIGSFTIVEMPVTLTGFSDPTHKFLAVQYEHPMVGQWVDFVVKFKDGGSATYTNGKTGHEMEQRPNHDKNYYPGAPLEVPYMKLKEEVTQLFQKAYEDDMTWRREKGGPSEAEIRRVAESSGIEMTDELMEKVKKKYEKDPTGGS
jgi:hypothetical protein